ncbi:hypothetical protein TNCV_2931701 [Trichonephila clavipes]|nr:hypothetical protein TNCV_2931701 [Trichonephila clavipes]
METCVVEEEMITKVSECLLTSSYKATCGFWVTDLEILSLGQVRRPTPRLEPPLQTTTPCQGEDFEPRHTSTPLHGRSSVA